MRGQGLRLLTIFNFTLGTYSDQVKDIPFILILQVAQVETRFVLWSPAQTLLNEVTVQVSETCIAAGRTPFVSQWRSSVLASVIQCLFLVGDEIVSLGRYIKKILRGWLFQNLDLIQAARRSLISNIVAVGAYSCVGLANGVVILAVVHYCIE